MKRPPSPSPTKRLRTWSPVEVEYLLNNRNTMTIAQIAKMVNHTEKATEIKYAKLIAQQKAA